MRKVNAITLAGLMTGLHLILVILFTYLPYTIFFELFTYIVAPLISAVYTLKSDNKYILIFALSTLIAGLLFNPVVTVTYILPILIIGISFGIIIKLGFDQLRIIYSMTLVYVAVFILTVVTLRLLYGINLEEILINVLNLNNNNSYLIYFLLMIYGLLQAIVITYVLKPEIKKFGYVIPGFKSINAYDFGLFVLGLSLAIIYPITDITFLVSVVTTFLALPIIVFGYIYNKLRTKTLIIGFSLSFLFIFIPLLGLLDPAKYPLAILGLFTPLIMLGLKRFVQLYYVRKQ